MQGWGRGRAAEEKLCKQVRPLHPYGGHDCSVYRGGSVERTDIEHFSFLYTTARNNTETIVGLVPSNSLFPMMNIRCFHNKRCCIL